MFTKFFLLLLITTTSALASYIPGTLSNPLSGSLDFTQISTPANPSAGLDRCYTKSDDKFYCLTSGGSEQLIGPASGSGTVTTVSVVSANGLAGTVATATTTPAITLSTTITGLLKGNGTAISAASSGTDYQAPITTSSAPANQFATGFSAPNTFTYAQPAFSDLSGNITAAQMLALTSANIYVGNGSNQPASVAPSGGFTINNTGVATLGNTAVTGQALTGFSAGAGVVAATDTILQAFNKVVGNAASYLSTTLNSAQIFVGNGSNVATAVSPSGGFTISNTGVATLGNTAVTGQPITGFTAGAGTVSATDTILQALQKIVGNFVAFKEVVQAGGTCSTSYSVAPNSGTMVTLTLNGACAIDVTGLLAGNSFTLQLTQSSTTTPTFSSAYKWQGGSAPTFSASATKYDVVSCESFDGTNLMCGALIDVR